VSLGTAQPVSPLQSETSLEHRLQQGDEGHACCVDSVSGLDMVLLPKYISVFLSRSPVSALGVR